MHAQKNSLKSAFDKIKNTMRKAIAFTLIPPLISCATLKTKEISTDCKMSCTIKANIIVCNLNDNELELDVPSNINIENEKIISESYQKERTIIITNNYIIRTLGWQQLENGSSILGVLGDNTYVQNALFISFKPIKEMGRIKNIAIVDENVVFTLEDNTIVIVNCDEIKPAKVIKNEPDKTREK